MTILLTGGGSGGHITPLLAVAQELKQLVPEARLVYAGERGGRFSHLATDSQLFADHYQVSAGKFRRYHGQGWWQRLSDIQTNLLNLRDVGRFIWGTGQSLWLLRRLRPDVILLKGGFVGVPIGLAAAFWHIPFITHDSDALPGLANRLVGRWAKAHATGMPAEFYGYPPHTVRYVGVLVSGDFHTLTAAEQRHYRQELRLPPEDLVLTITGGSLGAHRLNQALLPVVPQLLEAFPNLQIIHQVGKGQAKVYGDFQHLRLHVHEFLNPMFLYTGAADVVVTRAGGNTLAELGVQGKACIIVPNPFLTGGHQLKNAQYLAKNQAALIVGEETMNNPDQPLLMAITNLLKHPQERQALGSALQALSVPDSAQKLAELLLEVGQGSRVGQ